jgi:hypothetical protein
MRYAAALILLAGAAGTARADEIVLRNGARFEGKVKEHGDSVTVVMDFGSMTFRKMDVAKIHRGTSALAEFDARIVELKSDDLDGKHQLAIWARQNELHHRSRNLLEDILSRDPDHKGAREALGFRRHKGKWLTEDEIKIEQGFVLYRGDWMRRETAEELVKIEAELEAERIRAYEIEELRVRALEAEAAAKQAEADAEAARAQAAADYYNYNRPITFIYYRWHCEPRNWLGKPPACSPAPKGGSGGSTFTARSGQTGGTAPAKGTTGTTGGKKQ